MSTDTSTRLIKKSAYKLIMASIGLAAGILGTVAAVTGVAGLLFFGMGPLCAVMGAGTMALGFASAQLAMQGARKLIIAAGASTSLPAEAGATAFGAGNSLAPDFNPAALPCVEVAMPVKTMRPLKLSIKTKQP